MFVYLYLRSTKPEGSGLSPLNKLDLNMFKGGNDWCVEMRKIIDNGQWVLCVGGHYESNLPYGADIEVLYDQVQSIHKYANKMYR